MCVLPFFLFLGENIYFEHWQIQEKSFLFARLKESLWQAQTSLRRRTRRRRRRSRENIFHSANDTRTGCIILTAHENFWNFNFGRWANFIPHAWYSEFQQSRRRYYPFPDRYHSYEGPECYFQLSLYIPRQTYLVKSGNFFPSKYKKYLEVMSDHKKYLIFAREEGSSTEI